MDFSGKVLRREIVTKKAEGGTASLLKSWPLSTIAPLPSEAFLSLSLECGGETTFNETFFTEPKRCTLAAANVTAAITEADEGLDVRLSTDAPAFYVALAAEGFPGEFSDNGFTLLPDEPRVLRFTPRKRLSLARFKKSLDIRHLRTTYR